MLPSEGPLGEAAVADGDWPQRGPALTTNEETRGANEVLLIRFRGETRDAQRGQIPEPLKQKYSADFGINWSVVTANAGAEVEAAHAASQLEAVSKFVINEKQPSCLQDAREWALDRMRVKLVSVRENTNLFLLVGQRTVSITALAGLLTT